MKNIATHLAFVILLTACGQQASETTPVAAEPAEPEVSIYAAALKNPSRPEADLERDAGRHPAEVLEFFGIDSGATVLDMFSGGGYYTEMLAHVVGDNGHVVSHMNKALLAFSGDEFEARHADNRLPNVEVLMAENNELDLEVDQFDAIIVTLNYHDLYWESEEYNWAKIEVENFLAELVESMKPGATLGIVDHYAAAGAPSETGSTLHRIDRGIVIAEVEAAGLILDGESDLLRNTDDDRSKSVFDPEIRGKTDRFILRFKKPE
jgi:predicted methyltransferase